MQRFFSLNHGHCPSDSIRWSQEERHMNGNKPQRKFLISAFLIAHYNGFGARPKLSVFAVFNRGNLQKNVQKESTKKNRALEQCKRWPNQAYAFISFWWYLFSHLHLSFYHSDTFGRFRDIQCVRYIRCIRRRIPSRNFRRNKSQPPFMSEKSFFKNADFVQKQTQLVVKAGSRQSVSGPMLLKFHPLKSDFSSVH